MKKIFTLVLLISSISFAQQEGFKSSHQTDWEFYKNNPQEVGKNIVSPLAKRTDLMKVRSMNKVVYGFHPYWKNGLESNYYFSMLTHLAYFSGDVDTATGGFTSTHSWSSASVVSLAKSYGIKIHFTITLFSGHSVILNNNSKRQALINNIISQINIREADGCNVDFEAVSSSLKDSLRTFIVQLGTALHAIGKELVVELPAVDWSPGWIVYGTTFFSETSPYVDYYFAMLYDYWWKGSSTAGPSSPLQSSSYTSAWHCLRSIDTYLSKGCPANKFIAGFPNYGNDWPVVSSARMAATTANATSRIYSEIKNEYIDTIPSSNQFIDAVYNVPWYRYIGGGIWRQVWYDDSLSWAKKFDSIKVKNVAGTGMWALGYDGSEPEMWGALKTAFASAANPLHTSLDDFESGNGHFTTSPTYSGTTLGIATTSTSAQSNDMANNGWGSLQVVLKDNTSSTGDWYVRLLSGAGTPANNSSFGITGYLGFWMKTTSSKSGLQTALSVDDGAGGTLISSKQNITADGAWHLYEWNLATTSWSILSGSDAVLDGPTATLDAVMLYAANDAADWTLYMDDVSYNTAGPLPVELDRMNAFNHKLDVHLQWRTATESDNYGFEIERLSSSLDFLSDRQAGARDDNWIKIGFVEGAGTYSSPREYSFTDNVSQPGKYVYRLRQIDRNGAYRYSQEMFVTISGYPESYTLEQNFPNPFNPTTTIQYSVPDGERLQTVTLRVYDVLGKEIAALVDEKKNAGIYSVQWNAKGLASGVYFYTMRAGDFSATKKLLLMK